MNNTLIRIHALAPFDRSAKARWLLTEMKQPFEMRWLDRDKKEHESPEFLRLNPMGRVPVTEVGDLSFFESGAICTYLADLFPEKGLAPAPTSSERAKYLQWMFFAESTLDRIQSRIMIIEDIPAGELRSTKESALLSDFSDAMTALNQTLLENHYVVGNRFTAADICVGYHLYFCFQWPELEVLAKPFPRILAYLDNLKKMPSALQADAFSYQG